MPTAVPDIANITVGKGETPHLLEVSCNNKKVPYPHQFDGKETCIAIQSSFQDERERRFRVFAWLKDRRGLWVRIPSATNQAYQEHFVEYIMRRNATKADPHFCVIAAVPEDWGTSPYGIDRLPNVVYDDSQGKSDVDAIAEWHAACCVADFQHLKDIYVCQGGYGTCCSIAGFWTT